MKLASIRFRLTAWYFAVFASGLCIFGVGAWFAMRASLYHSVDDTLRDRIEGIAQFMTARLSSLSLSEIREEFREHSILGLGGDLFQICDQQGNWLYRSAPLEAGQLRVLAPSQLGPTALYENVEIQTTPVRLASQRVMVAGRPYTIQVASSMHELLESLELFQWTLLVSIPLLLLAAAGGGYWISRRALAPVDEITRTARSISIQNLSDRLSVPATGDELQRLSETLNEMLAELNGSVRRITQFTADASHELRAPIALIRTTAELSLRKDREKNEYQDALRQVHTESERMTQLLDSLLLLARADSQTDDLQLVPMNLGQSVHEALEQGRALASEKEIEVEAEIFPVAIEIEGDPPAIRRLFLILIDNAIKYSPAGGQVRISLYTENGFAVGVVRDSGIGIAEQDQSHVFDRFWRADKARSREMGGAGLGLSIARWIVERHGGRIELESKLGHGATFRVRLPVSVR